MRNYKQVDFFVERKEASIIRYGAKACISNMLAVMDGEIDNGVFISFSESSVLLAREMGFRRTAIVTDDWPHREAISDKTQADYIFIEQSHIPHAVEITTNVPVIVYKEDPKKVRALLARGAFAVETFNSNGLVGEE